MTGRPPAPDFQIKFPSCPICGTETEQESDTYICEVCCAYWDFRGKFIEWYGGGDSEQCDTMSASMNHYTGNVSLFRCILNINHGGEHRQFLFKTMEL